MKIKNILLLWLPHIWLNCLAILLSGLAVAQEIKTLPDWSGVWERYEGNGGIFDISTLSLIHI